MGLEDNYKRAIILLSRNKDLQNAIISISKQLPDLMKEMRKLRLAMDKIPRSVRLHY